MTILARPRKTRSAGGVQIRDVARHAGVSAITVSRHLNEPERVAEKTRARIATAIEELGYIPNLAARTLSSNKANLVGAIVPTISNSIFADYIAGLSDVLEAQGFKLLISSSGYALEREAALIETLIAQQPAGIVVTGQSHSDHGRGLLQRLTIPVVETWETGSAPIDISVGFSNFSACYEMTRALQAAGYRRIAFVSAPVAANDRATGRRRGYLAAMGEAGLPVRPGWIREAGFSFVHGAEILGELVGAHGDLEAVFFANDILAIGALTECQRRGIRNPDDIGICGFDDVELAAMMMPTLSTVRVPRYDIGRRAAEIILAPAGAARPHGNVVDLGFEIVSRASTAPISHQPRGR
jgi:LacI family transcriptional regulator, gluconate utilization system Gnt-I transcriptional repressor